MHRFVSKASTAAALALAYLPFVAFVAPAHAADVHVKVGDLSRAGAAAAFEVRLDRSLLHCVIRGGPGKRHNQIGHRIIDRDQLPNCFSAAGDFGAGAQLVPWLASQTDLLMDDWEVIVES